MTKLAKFSGQELTQIFLKLGYRVIRQRGSHVRLWILGRKPITIPRHPIIGDGLLRKILRDAEMSVDEFSRLIKRK